MVSTKELTRRLERADAEEATRTSECVALALISSAEPPNATPFFEAKPLLCNSEGHSTRHVPRPKSVRVPVVSKSGKPLMPCRPSKARKLLKQGLAEKAWSKLGVFYIRLLFDPQSEHNKNQQVCLGLDVGSKFEGVAIVSKKHALLTGMIELPKGIFRRLKQRRRQRRFRRYRKTRRRPCRFNNRKRKDGWIAPSQKAKVDFRLRVIDSLSKLFPITDYAVEDVKFNHYKKKWGKHFSTVEIGKAKTYSALRKKGELHLFEGFETAELREQYKLKKEHDKRKRCFESHAVDALAISSKTIGLENLNVPSFYVWKEYQYPRRQLHRFQFFKGSVRRRYGGSQSLNGFKKGDVVLFKGKLARVGGHKDGAISLHKFDLDNKRFTQKANPTKCVRLFNQRIMYSEFLPRTSSGVSFGGFL